MLFTYKRSFETILIFIPTYEDIMQKLIAKLGKSNTEDFQVSKQVTKLKQSLEILGLCRTCAHLPHFYVNLQQFLYRRLLNELVHNLFRK